MNDSNNYESIELGMLPFAKQNSTSLYPLQWLPTQKLEKHNCVYIFDETGAGKTISAGNCILNTLIKEKLNKINILILCPQNLTLNWYNKLMSLYGIEFKLWSNTQRSNRFIDPIGDNLIIASYNSNKEGNATALNYLARTDFDSDFNWDLIVLDEAHNIKGNEINKNIKELKAKKVVVITATPINNKLEELQSLINVTQQIINNIPNEYYSYFINNKDTILEDCSIDHPFMRNFKEIISDTMPKIRKIENIEYTIDPMTYQNFKSKFPTRDLEYFHNCSNLNQYIVNNQRNDKLDKFISKIRYCLTQKQKVIVFCRRVETIKYLTSELIALGITTKGITSESFNTIDNRKKFIQNTNKQKTEESKYDVIITIDTLLNEGYDMTSFNVIMNYELPFTPAQLEQRYGRIDRLKGSKYNEIYMYNFKNIDYSDEFDGAFHNILRLKLSEQVLSNIPSKSLMSIKEINDSIQVTFDIYSSLCKLEKSIPQSMQQKDMTLGVIFAQMDHLITNGSLTAYQYRLLHSLFEERYIFWRINQNQTINLREIIKGKENVLKRICKVDANTRLTQQIINNNLITATNEMSGNVLWVDHGIILKPLDEIKKNIQNNSHEIELQVNKIKDSLIAFNCQESDLGAIWNSIKLTNHSYCTMVFNNLWKCFFKQNEDYKQFIRRVNEVINNES